jgi:outer membrane protein assembly factor BamA
VSGIGIDSNLLRFGKQLMQSYWTMPVFGTSFLAVGGELGLMMPWGPGYWGRTTYISDRFFLGGTSNLRGFAYRSVGPIDARRMPSSEGRSEVRAFGHACGSAIVLVGDVWWNYTSACAIDAIAPQEETEPDRPKHDYLGGDAYASIFAAFNFDLPHTTLQAIGMRGHVFVNGGNAELLSGTGRTFRECALEFASRFRWSLVGCTLFAVPCQLVFFYL